MRDPLVLPLAAVVAGILLGRLSAFSPSSSAWPIVAFLLIALLAAGRSCRKLAFASLGLSLVFVGVWTESWHQPPPAPQIDAGLRETVLLDGCVVDPPVFSLTREQFTLELDTDARARVTLPLDAVSPAPPFPALDYGQRVEIEARVRAPHNFNNPGSFDYAAYLARQHIYWAAVIKPGSPVRILPGRCGSRWAAAIFWLRQNAVRRIEALYPRDDYSSGMMEAVLIGETARLEKIWTENFRRTGTFHALVISGAHIAVLAGILIFCLRFCALPEITTLAIACATAWIYALVSGFSAPVARSAAGFTLYLVARFVFRKGRVINLLAAVAIVYLLCDPAQLFDASFQLSFLCVAAIGAIAAPILDLWLIPHAHGLRSITSVSADPHLDPRIAQFRVEIRLAAETLHLWTRLPSRGAEHVLAASLRIAFFTAEMAVISTVIQIGLALPMAEYFHRFSFTGLSANLLIVPLLEFVVPAGFLAIFTGWHWIASLAAWLLRISARVADWHALHEPSWRVSDPPLWLALAFTLSLLALALCLRHRIWRRTIFAVTLGLFALLLWQPWPAQVAPHLLELDAIDVGQGDSLLVIFPEGKRMLVDGGGVLQFGQNRRRTNLDTGEDVVSPYLWSRGIRHVDVIVATHAHEDHSGGIPALLNNFHPAELWFGTNPSPRLLEEARRLHITPRSLRASAPFDLSGARVQILSPPPGYYPKTPGNNDSLALRISYGQRSFLLTGDMERLPEFQLLDRDAALRSDVLKVGHHGSKTSTTPAFLDAVSPSVALISAGYGNSFGHPHPDVLSRLADRHTAILRTDQNGLIGVRTDGQRLWMDANSWHSAGSPRRLLPPGLEWALAQGW